MAEADELLEKYSAYKMGEILTLKKYPQEDYNEWEIYKYMIGGYELINLKDSSTLLVETHEVAHAVADLKRIEGHKGHEVVKTFVSNPNHNSFLYCRDCKDEVFTRYKKF